MPLTIGTTLGPNEVLSAIGAGESGRALLVEFGSERHWAQMMLGGSVWSRS